MGPKKVAGVEGGGEEEDRANDDGDADDDQRRLAQKIHGWSRSKEMTSVIYLL